MSETEEIPQPEQTEPVETTTPVVEKVKKERSEAQRLVLEKARAKGLEVRLQKAKERKEAKENALREVEEKYKKVEVEKFEPEPEPEPEPPVKVETKPEPAELPREPTPEPPEPVLPDYEWKDKRLTYRI